MAYSNVTPPTLSAYDSTACPFYVLVFNYGLGEEDWYQVHLYYSATAFTYDPALGITNTGVTFHQVGDNESWEVLPQGSEAPTLKPGKDGNVYKRIYTKHEILDGSGNVYLAEGAVTPAFDLQSWLTGFALGLAGKPLGGVLHD